MRKLFFLLCSLVLLAGCARGTYDAREEFKNQSLNKLQFSYVDLRLGVQFKDETVTGSTQQISGDLAVEAANWLAERLSDEKKFKEVVDLNWDKDKQVDVILQGIIQQIKLEEPGAAGRSRALSFIYDVTPGLERHVIRKWIDSTATVRFQLLEPKTRKVLWEQTLTEKITERTKLSRASQLIFAAITKSVETLLTETRLREELKAMQPGTYAAAEAPAPLTKEPEVSHEDGKPFPGQTGVSQRWAVVIGISKYKDSRIPTLRYASADAMLFYNWLVSPKGGRYAPSRVKLLVNSDATGRNIKEALYVWLRQALEEDLVVIYFANHGSSESPDSQQNLFLLPYDANYDSIASTGFPMWDVETALKRFIKARRVIIMADACHSGGVGRSFEMARRDHRSVRINRISSGFQNLSQIGEGVCVISASDEKQLSREDRKWGGGHGVFTYYLIQGLNGHADYNKDGAVTLGELIPYLSEKVRRETENVQSPTVAGRFDPAMSIGK